MKKMSLLLALITLLIITASAQSQIAPDKYWIQFADKNNTPYSIKSISFTYSFYTKCQKNMQNPLKTFAT